MSAPAELVAALPQYDIGESIGEGGMGVVFAGVHRTLGRSVAIKQLPWDVLNHAASSELFDREARVLASLDHPHIVPVYDYVRTGREHLLVMERLDGGTVHSRFHGGGVSGEQACAIGLAMLAGLHAAHRAGVLHLDVKPRNLLFSTQGVVKVADFGIARVISEGATLVTHGGEILGTPAYIAPEQAMGNALSPAADVYAAGTVLYELLSGRLPFDNTRGAISMMRQHMFTDPQPIMGVPMPIAGVVMRSLARELDARYREAESFAADLAAAATVVYGPGWLERAGVPVLHLTPRVIAGLNSATAPALPAEARTRPVVRPGATLVGAPTSPPPSLPPGPDSPVTSSAAVLWLRLAAGAAAIVLVVLALLNPARLPHPASSALNLGGASVSAPVEVDLSKPLVLTGPGNPGRVALDLSAAGIPLGSAATEAKPDGNGFTAALTLPGIARWIVGGAVTADVRTGSATRTFTLLTSQHPLASAMGAGSLILALFALAYLESGLRTIRSGHRWRGAAVGGPVLGLLFGAAVWLCVSVLRVHEPSPGFGAGCAVAGAVAAGLVVAAARRRASTVVSRPSGR
ncbi:serine/threonine protein kinase [Amycolatopsis mediterranei S699]|uniref:non-specific serine/threonine protein kinase n=3 Tax=Amycolatopsis mediterranei TaxID=33910 RepID=A0A0H3DF30_AMYMU|nr:serine/threonine-protein kinase [Amycolatopsis mediterranei]ADJ49296.1 serine/threonine protein kinase [Amycolatopsis mediterranei U32]AEK46260.1 serine/threonine protein kinase [Amycolatopsis mediterranei S699]AFO81003.1 serine/threonine protein kinase [Amycolatopsis mediterranei S699]AGT88131.1 serine/threonine protein kinase [Amycolatopsis mediterranei RB]KDO09416.1 serine/threonine protein kinase [Amycolatopsis mediterranei]